MSARNPPPERRRVPKIVLLKPGEHLPPSLQQCTQCGASTGSRPLGVGVVAYDRGAEGPEPLGELALLCPQCFSRFAAEVEWAMSASRRDGREQGHAHYDALAQPVAARRPRRGKRS